MNEKMYFALRNETGDGIVFIFRLLAYNILCIFYPFCIKRNGDFLSKFNIF